MSRLTSLSFDDMENSLWFQQTSIFFSVHIIHILWNMLKTKTTNAPSIFVCCVRSNLCCLECYVCFDVWFFFCLRLMQRHIYSCIDIYVVIIITGELPVVIVNKKHKENHRHSLVLSYLGRCCLLYHHRCHQRQQSVPEWNHRRLSAARKTKKKRKKAIYRLLTLLTHK